MLALRADFLIPISNCNASNLSLDFMATRLHIQSVKRRIIKALLIGSGITVFGIALIYFLALFFPEHFDHSKPAIFECCLNVLVTAVFLPGKVLSIYFGDVGITFLLILTGFFWVCFVFFLMQVNQTRIRSGPISTR